MTSTPVTWFEIGTDRPDEAQGFYAELFGWTFTEEGTAGGGSYRTTTAGEPTGIGGGIRALVEGAPGYAILYAEVADVAQACGRAEAAGGTVLTPPRTTPGGLTLALLRDPVGTHLGLFSSGGTAA
ncbi:VOC family protein [Micromonospora sp. HM134]|uniref:VOC family protein n=1 Tax=unclassified Micromonospora TaxID=2617518 RepID=UPI0011985FD6|nr:MULTISPECIES: VOC family protein [unclassified Micromonospora]QDY09925.1 VOC family protein [Micromonospora sp. HM134]